MLGLSLSKLLATIIILAIGLHVPVGQHGEGNYLFTFAQITDSHIGIHANSAVILKDTMNWLAHQRNVVFVVHTGDIVDHSRKLEEWKEAYRIMHTFDDVCNWTVLAGNHDVQESGGAPVNLTLYKQHFGEEAVNHFYMVDNRLLFILLSWTTRDGSIPSETLDWMDQIIEDNSNLYVVVCLHPYLYPSGLLDIRWGMVPNAQEVWSHLDRHDNLILTLSGHLHHNWVRIHVHNQHKIWSICTAALKDEGYVRLFDVYEDRIEVRGHSAWTKRDYLGLLDHFTIELTSNNYDVDGDLWPDSTDIKPTDALIPILPIVGVSLSILALTYLVQRIIRKRSFHKVRKTRAP